MFKTAIRKEDNNDNNNNNNKNDNNDNVDDKDKSELASNREIEEEEGEGEEVDSEANKNWKYHVLKFEKNAREARKEEEYVVIDPLSGKSNDSKRKLSRHQRNLQGKKLEEW